VTKEAGGENNCRQQWLVTGAMHGPSDPRWPTTSHTLTLERVSGLAAATLAYLTSEQAIVLELYQSGLLPFEAREG